MNRYHTPLGTGKGISVKGPWNGPITQEHFGLAVMREEKGGFWVLYQDAIKFSTEEFERGKKLGAVGLVEPSKVKVAELPNLGNPPDQVNDKRLLNELYHDRARLERVVQDAVDIMDTVKEFLTQEQDEDGELHSEHWLMGLVQQFSDTHANKD